jgi:excisionase family DNA binding protein
VTGKLFTAAEAAAELRCHEKTVRRMIGRGEIPARMVAGKWLIDPMDLPTRQDINYRPQSRPARVRVMGDGPCVQAARRVLAAREAEAA